MMKYSFRVSNVSISWRMFGWLTLERQKRVTHCDLTTVKGFTCNWRVLTIHWLLNSFLYKEDWVGVHPFSWVHTSKSRSYKHLSVTLLITVVTWIVWLETWTEISNNKTFSHSPSLRLSPSLSHTSICPQTDRVQFQDHDFVLGSLADFPAVFLEEFLADKHLVCLSVLSQAELAELLPTQEEKKIERQKDREKGRKGKYNVRAREKCGCFWKKCIWILLIKTQGRQHNIRETMYTAVLVNNSERI